MDSVSIIGLGIWIGWLTYGIIGDNKDTLRAGLIVSSMTVVIFYTFKILDLI